MTDVVAPPQVDQQYQPYSHALDEVYLSDGKPRPEAAILHQALTNIGSESLHDRARLRDAVLNAQGITFTLSGRERPLPLDLIPRLISTQDWAVIEAGVAQRIRALELFLADVYGPGHILADGIVPRALVTSSAHFHREVFGITPPNGVRIHVAGIDLVRDAQGTFRVLEDNLRCPSGVSYVLENRRTLAHVLPEIFQGHRVRPVQEYPEKLIAALRASAPHGIVDPTVVVLTAGVHNSAHFEHAFLARRMGVELVEGRDLFCRDGSVYMRTTRGARPVHVVYRRIDDDYLDPVHFKPDSVLGIPGIINAARAGAVTIANGVGNGVADDKAFYPHVPAVIEYYLGEKPILPNVDTYDLTDPDQLDHVANNIDNMVLKPVDGSGGYGLMVGSQATDEEKASAIAVARENPRGWIGQPILSLSTSPTVGADGKLAPRHIDLRPFAVNDGQNIYVLPGGLTRVALVEGSLVVNSSQGGGSKDTWVLDDEDVAPVQAPVITEPPKVSIPTDLPMTKLPPRETGPATTEDYRLRQQEEQQQQAGDAPC
jgi:uncharacterized circularly permuted ATP-grasp superfamily protein